MDLFEYAQKTSLETPEAQESIFTVSEITSQVKTLITRHFSGQTLWVKGEISNFRGRNQSGHMYFRLKDAGAVLSCVFFRNLNQRLKVDLEDGMEVLARGRVDVWEKGGSYQLVVEEIRIGGTGELYLRFEQLKEKLENEGLFAPERKRPLPSFPHRIGLVTSPTGAVIRDIIHVIQRRFPFVHLFLSPVRVQGEGAAEEIAQAIAKLNDHGHNLDLLVIGRGGGSIEDLWAFNEESVARAIVASELPVISAVGHQTDFTIADFVADVRAATPSQAAELAVPNVMEMEQKAKLLIRNITRELIHVRDMARQKLDASIRSPFLRDPRILLRSRIQALDLAVERLAGHLQQKRRESSERLEQLLIRMRGLLVHLLAPRQAQLQRANSNLTLLNPLGVLERGYSVVRKPTGTIVRSGKQVSMNEDLNIKLFEGELECRVQKISEQ